MILAIADELISFGRKVKRSTDPWEVPLNALSWNSWNLTGSVTRIYDAGWLIPKIPHSSPIQHFFRLIYSFLAFKRMMMKISYVCCYVIIIVVDVHTGQHKHKTVVILIVVRNLRGKMKKSEIHSKFIQFIVHRPPYQSSNQGVKEQGNHQVFTWRVKMQEAIKVIRLGFI